MMSTSFYMLSLHYLKSGSIILYCWIDMSSTVDASPECVVHVDGGSKSGLRCSREGPPAGKAQYQYSEPDTLGLPVIDRGCVQELGVLTPVLETDNYAFAMELAVTAAVNNALDLEQWLPTLFAKTSDPFVTCLASFLHRKYDAATASPLSRQSADLLTKVCLCGYVYCMVCGRFCPHDAGRSS